MAEKVALSARMRALTDMVTAGNRVCDVGCDHGWVSIYLVQQGISPWALAMDVRQGPLSRAREHIRQQGLEAYIETRLSDGVAALETGETDTVICAGMGGRLMRRILEEGREKLAAAQELILQPQSEIAAFRAYLRRSGYAVLAEDMVLEDGKYYPVMKVRAVSRGPGAEDPADRTADADCLALKDRFGRLLLADRHPVLRQYLLEARRSNQEILERLRRNAAGSRAGQRIRELEEEQRLIGLALERFEQERTKDENNIKE